MPNDNNRVLTRRGARQLSQDEIEQTSGAATPLTQSPTKTAIEQKKKKPRTN